MKNFFPANYKMNEQEYDKVVLVTGASSGIGRACSKLLLEQGYTVVGVGRDFSDCDTTNKRFHPVMIDFSDIISLPEKLAELGKAFPNIHSIVLCAGSGRFGSLEEFSFEQIRMLMDTNFTSQAYVLRQFLPGLKKHGAGDIVIIGSESALAGGRRGAIYSASKFALRGLAQSLRGECSRSGVRITLINPGMVRTGFFSELDFTHGDEPENYIEPGDVANTVVHVLKTRPETVFDEINLSPLKNVVRPKKPGGKV